MTRFEREDWQVSGSSALRLFDTAIGCLGVCICYEVQFPLLARGLVEAGAELILVPLVTETLHGYWRVRTGARARALESQCYVVHAPVVGEAPWSPEVDVNRGADALYGPPDKGFPPDGGVAIGELDRPGWTHAELDLDLAAAVRADGMVLNHRHWP